MLFTEAVEHFRTYQESVDKSKNTINSYNNDLAFFIKYLVKMFNCTPYLTDVTTDDLEEYLSYLKDSKSYTSASRKRKLAVFRTFFNFCIKKKYCTINAAVGIEPIKVKHQERLFLDEEEVMKIVDHIDHKLIRLVVLTLYYTGLRISECINLNIDDVNLNKNVIKVVKGKGLKERFIPIHNRLLPLLKDYIVNDRPYTITNNFFSTPTSGKLSAPHVNKHINKAAKKMECKEKISAHTFRHAFASNLVKRNINVVQIQKLLGHSNLITTSIYTHSKFEDLELAVNKL